MGGGNNSYFESTINLGATKKKKKLGSRSRTHKANQLDEKRFTATESKS